MGGAEYGLHIFTDFMDCVTIMGLTDMRYRGNFLTWSNRKENCKYCKLDIVLVNDEWVGEYPDFEAKFLNPGATSDHSSMLFRL